MNFRRSEIDAALLARLLDVVERDIMPKISEAVAQGNEAFGAAIVRASDLSLVVAGANHEQQNELLHGSIRCLQQFFDLSQDQRPAPEQLIFVVSHKPSLLSHTAIASAGFASMFYFFDGEFSQDPIRDLRHPSALEDLFGPDFVCDPERLDLLKPRNIMREIGRVQDGLRSELERGAERIKSAYSRIGETAGSTAC